MNDVEALGPVDDGYGGVDFVRYGSELRREYRIGRFGHFGMKIR